MMLSSLKTLVFINCNCMEKNRMLQSGLKPALSTQAPQHNISGEYALNIAPSELFLPIQVVVVVTNEMFTSQLFSVVTHVTACMKDDTTD